MILLATHHRPGDTFVLNSVMSCKRHMPNEEIAILDGSSPSREYHEFVKAAGAWDFDTRQNGYEAGAWHWAWQNLRDDFFYCLQDSVIVQDDLTKYVKGPVTVVGRMEDYSGCDDMHKDYIKRVLLDSKYEAAPETFWAVFGNMFFAERWVLDRVFTSGLERHLPTNKMESQAWERIWGIVFALEGFNLEQCGLGLGRELDRDSVPVRKVPGMRGN